MKPTNPALVLGLSPTGLIAIRSLGRNGIPVYGADIDSVQIGRFSSYCHFVRHLAELSRRRDGEVLCTGLIEFSRRFTHPPVLYVTSDIYIDLLTPHFPTLQKHFLLSTDLATSGRVYLDKRRFYDLCREHAVELPFTACPTSEDDLRAISTQLRYPAVLKPAYGHRWRSELGWRKLVTVSNREELFRRFDQLASTGLTLIVQELVPGSDDQIHVAACYFDRQSEPKAMFVGRKLRQYPPHFGSASLAESRWNEKVARASIDFLRATRFRGICGTEYKRDPRDGRYKMVEVNARLTLWMALTGASGIDLPLLAYQDLTDEQVEVCTQSDGVRWSYFIRDLQSSAHYVKTRELTLRRWWNSVKQTDVDAVFAKDDLKVFSFVPVWMAARALRRIG